MRRTRMALAAIAAAGALTLAACQASTGGESAGGGSATSGGGEKTSEAGTGGGGDKITIGIKFDQPGMGFKDGDTYTGFDVDVAKYVAKQLGFEENQITWVEAQSANRETMLQNGNADMIVGTYTINDKRKQVVDFAGPYFVAGQDLLIRSDETGITGPKDLNGKNLCSVAGSTSAQRVKDDFSPDTQLIERGGYSECVQYLLGGQVDAVTTDDIILAGLAANDGSGALKVVGAPFSEEPYGIGLPKGSDKCTAVVAAINKMIDDGDWKTFLETNTKGTGYTPSDKNPPKPADTCG